MPAHTSPAPADASAPAPAAAASAEASAPVAEAQVAPVPSTPTIVPLPYDEFQRMVAATNRLAEIEAKNAEIERQKEADKAQHLIKQGELEKGIELLKGTHAKDIEAERAKAATIEQRAKSYALDGELARALAAQPLVSPEAALQLATLWRAEFQVHAEGDSFKVRTPTLQSVNEFVQQRLASPAYAHFVRATGHTGTAGGPTSAAIEPPTPPAYQTAPPQPKNMGEALIAWGKANKVEKSQNPASTNMSAPFGLRRMG